MNGPEFSPGFRISPRDSLVLIVGTLGTLALSAQIPIGAFVVGFVVLHFFLFCNVFRIPRCPELIWAGSFVSLSASTIYTDVPGWIATFATSLALSMFLICRSLFQPDYHGVCWQRINPGLRGWWEEQVGRIRD